MQSVFITTIDEDLITAQRMVYLIQLYVIKFVNGFNSMNFSVLNQKKIDRHNISEILLKVK